MRSASAEFRRTMSQRRNFVNYADVWLATNTTSIPSLRLEPKDFRLGGNTITDDIVDGDAFTVGTALGKTVTIALDNTDERFSLYDFYNAVFDLFVALPMDNGIMTKIKIGKFTVITPATTGTIITMEAIDNMYKFDKPYSESNLTYPATLSQIIIDACSHCGIINNALPFDRSSLIVPTRPEGDITYRQVISYVAQIACANAKIDKDGQLIFTWYPNISLDSHKDGGNFRTIYDEHGHYLTGDALDGGTFTYNDGDPYDGGGFNDVMVYHNLGSAKQVSVGTDDITITGVRVINGKDTDILVGTDVYCLQIKDNPLTKGNEQQIAREVAAKLSTLTFRPFSLSYLQDPTIESGDWVLITDAKKNTYLSVVTNLKFTTGGYMTISCNAQPPAKQSSMYQSTSAKILVAAARDTAEKLSLYDQAVQRMSQLAANAGGLYWLEWPDPNGGSIYYESDQPMSIDSNGDVVFTQNSHAWKRTNTGFFNCPSTGTSEATTTWIGGIDMNNNAVMNTIAAIGISFDWAIGGTLTLGGYGNGNGILSILDANDVEKVHGDNTGIKAGSTTGSRIHITTDGEIEYDYDNAYGGRIHMDAVNYGTEEEPELRDTFLIENFNDMGFRTDENMAEIYMSTEQDSESSYDTGYIKLFAHKQTGEQTYQYSELRLDGNGFHIDSAIYVGGGQGYSGAQGYPDVIGTDFKRHTLTFAEGICIGYESDPQEAELPHVEWHRWASSDPSTYYVAITLGEGVTQAVFPECETSDDEVAYEPFIKSASGTSAPKITDISQSGSNITVTFTAVTAAQAAGNACAIRLLKIRG